MRVLVVDDDEDSCALLCMGLERSGIEPRPFTDLAEAEAALGAQGVDAVLTDWHLGEGTAASLIDAAEGRPVVLLTGDDRALAGPWPKSVHALRKPASLADVVALLTSP